MTHFTAEFPLVWPDGWPETPPEKRLKWMAGAYGNTPPWDVVLKRLETELTRLGATSIVLSTNQPIRRDGQPYAARRRIEDAGAAVYFTHKGKDLVMAQDRYKLLADNIRSLCLAIEGIRQVERHGGGVMVERAFAGFERLPPPANRGSWRDVFGVGHYDPSPAELKKLYQRLAGKRHPDKPGGSVERMQTLNEAYRAARQELRYA